MSFSKLVFALFPLVLSCALSAQSPALLASAKVHPVLPSTTLLSEITPAKVFKAATYPGGQEALLNQLRTSVKYPQLAREYAIEGTVVVRLSLGANGRVTDREVVRSLGFGCDEAALKAVAKLDRFQPAIRAGHQRSSVVYLPLRFRLR